MKNLIIAKIPKELKISILNPNIKFRYETLDDFLEQKKNQKEVVTRITDIPKEKLKLAIIALLRNNPKTIINEISYSELEQALKISADKIIETEKQINEICMTSLRGLSEWIYQEKNRQNNDIISDFTFLESEKDKKLEDYISLFDVFNIQKTIIEKFKKIKELEHVCNTKLTNANPFYIFDLKFDYNHFLLNDTSGLKSTISLPLLREATLFIERNKTKYICLEAYQVNLNIIQEEVLEVLDILENYKKIFNMPNNFLVPIRNYDGQIIINEERIILMNENFPKLEISMNGKVTCSSDNYKAFLFLSENYNKIMKNTYLEKDDIPFCNEQSYSFVNKYTDKKKSKTLYKK